MLEKVVTNIVHAICSSTFLFLKQGLLIQDESKKGHEKSCKFLSFL